MRLEERKEKLGTYGYNAGLKIEEINGNIQSFKQSNARYVRKSNC